jgi:murein DD-endopeptidase / murein LD-carboxypeptidase
MTNRRKFAPVKKRKIALYLLAIFIAVQVAANADGDHEVVKEITPRVETVSVSRAVSARIAAFKKGGIEKRVNTDNHDIEGVIDYAKSLVGTPHVMGGYSSRGIDCSGLVALAHAQFGVALPRSSHDQARYGNIISAGEHLKRGDIVFFHSTYKKNHLVTHTGIYLGDDEFIHASSSRGVTISKLSSDYYRKHYLFATRLSN